MVPIYKGGDRLVVGSYVPLSVNSMVCKRLEYLMAGYLRQVWEMSGWLCEGQHGFRPGYSSESQVVRFVRISRIYWTRGSGQTR